MARPRKLPFGRVRDAVFTHLEYARRAGTDAADKRVVAIIGMHRSGTSAVAGALQEAGLYLGNVLRKHESNRRGTREHLGIVRLHDEILAYSGGSWRNPPSKTVWSDEHGDRRDRIIASFSGAELWGFKDPRTVLLLDFWREALGDSVQLIGVFREPSAVVSSLLRRDGGSEEEWFAVWTRYNDDLLREFESSTFPLLEFGTDPERFYEQFEPVVRGLGLRASTGSGFFDPRLSSAPEPTAIPAAADALFDRLQAARTN